MKIPFFGLFEEVVDMREVSFNLFQNMHNLIIQQFGLASTREIPGESTEMHKEVKDDKEAIRELLAVLLPSRKKPMPTLYSDEVTFTPPPTSPGPHGRLDILIGVQVDGSIADGSTADGSAVFDIPIVVKAGEEDICLEKAFLAESKQHAGDLGNKALSDKADSSSTLQPIVQLLSVSQLPGFKKQELSLLFYGTRRYIRPYIYYHSQDILLTTADPLQWKKETGLDLHGTTAVAALLAEELKFKESLGFFFLMSWNLTQTGFMKAMEDAQVCLADSTLQSARMPLNKQLTIPAPSQSHADAGRLPSFFNEVNKFLVKMRSNQQSHSV